MNKPKDYLRKQYSDRYIVRRDACGDYNIQTRFKPHPEYGTMYDVYLFDDERLAACVPPRTGRRIAGDFPDIVEVYGEGIDCVVLLFSERELDALADRLRLRRRKRVSEKERQRLAEIGRRTRFSTAVRAKNSPNFALEIS